MKKVIEYFIKFPIWANAVIIVTAISGMLSHFLMPHSFFPELTPNEVYINVSYPGASPEEIEKGINKAERMKLLSDDRPQEAFEHIMSCMPDPQKKILKKIYIDPRYNQRLIKVTNQ